MSMTPKQINENNAVVTDMEVEQGEWPFGMKFAAATVTHAFVLGELLTVTPDYCVANPWGTVAAIDSGGPFGAYIEKKAALHREDDLYRPKNTRLTFLLCRQSIVWWAAFPNTKGEDQPRQTWSGPVMPPCGHPIGQVVHIATVTHAFRGTLLDVSSSHYIFDQTQPFSLVDSTGPFGAYLTNPPEVTDADTFVPKVGSAPRISISRGAAVWIAAWATK